MGKLNRSTTPATQRSSVNAKKIRADALSKLITAIKAGCTCNNCKYGEFQKICFASYRELAAYLNKREVPTQKGGAWHNESVRRLLKGPEAKTASKLLKNIKPKRRMSDTI